ncbi:LytR/AlgR family response regulator transcription factor [Actinocorallia populi]|uniref:LytR/AlgR family response regulator transcription factor n=1 Tax=Actinocorallia populi TaxID=2079200 RepID=UPI000D09639E|nr:LytTR family DNA-binding domain-containing protein [Actinocorallia populi]
MLRVLAVDDEPPALDELIRLLRADPRIDRVAGACDPAEALRGLSRVLAGGDRLDAVFLDVRMPGLDGFDFTRLLAGFAEPPVVVFVTAHADGAVAAFDLGAVDYLLKPVRPERLAEAVRRVERAVRRGGDEAAPDEVIPVELGGRTRMVSRSAVTHVEAHGDYVRLHTVGEGAGYLVRIPLTVLARRWEGAGFIRIHRSTLVSSAHIEELLFDEGRASVRVGGAVLAVSRRHTRRVRDLLVRGFKSDRNAGPAADRTGPDRSSRMIGRSPDPHATYIDGY